MTARPGEEFAFDVTVFGMPVSRWSYRLTVAGDAAAREFGRARDRPPANAAMVKAQPGQAARGRKAEL